MKCNNCSLNYTVTYSVYRKTNAFKTRPYLFVNTSRLNGLSDLQRQGIKTSGGLPQAAHNTVYQRYNFLFSYNMPAINYVHRVSLTLSNTEVLINYKFWKQTLSETC